MTNFTMIPAIDLMDGQCVRLQQGDAKRRTNYPESPEVVAKRFEDAGATRLHIVDLDGAFNGTPTNLETIRKIRDAVKMTVELGGGIRSAEDIKKCLDCGVDHVILGTRAMEDLDFLGQTISQFGADKIIVGADARNGFLSTRGWTSDSQIEAIPYLRKIVSDQGVNTVIFTDIARDGMFNSPNFTALEEVCAIAGLKVIASGGVGTPEDIKALCKLNRENLIGVIVGKAIHDGRITVEAALNAVI